MFNFGIKAVHWNVRQGDWQRMWVRFTDNTVELIGVRKGIWTIVQL